MHLYETVNKQLHETPHHLRVFRKAHAIGRHRQCLNHWRNHGKAPARRLRGISHRSAPRTRIPLLVEIFGTGETAAGSATRHWPHYDGRTNFPLRTRRIAFTPMTFPNETINQLPLPPLTFVMSSPPCWEDIRFGVILGSYLSNLSILPINSRSSGLISQTHIALANTKLYTDMKENYIRTIKALAIAVDAKDTYTHGHSENVMEIRGSNCP